MKKIILAGLVVGGFLFFYLSQQEEPIVTEKQDDTGLTREETEALMRKIGYVQ